jgi:hypothetical protein
MYAVHVTDDLLLILGLVVYRKSNTMRIGKEMNKMEIMILVLCY